MVANTESVDSLVEALSLSPAEVATVDDFGIVVAFLGQGNQLVLLIGWCFKASQVLEGFGVGLMVNGDVLSIRTLNAQRCWGLLFLHQHGCPRGLEGIMDVVVLALGEF